MLNRYVGKSLQSYPITRSDTAILPLSLKSESYVVYIAFTDQIQKIDWSSADVKFITFTMNEVLSLATSNKAALVIELVSS